MCVCVAMCVCVHACLCMHVIVRMSLCMHVFACLSVYMTVCAYPCVCVCTHCNRVYDVGDAKGPFQPVKPSDKFCFVTLGKPLALSGPLSNAVRTSLGRT